MIKIDYLKNHLELIPQLAHIWHEVLGKTWLPDISIERVITRFSDHINDDKLPMTIVALDGMMPVGMCSLRENDGIRPDIGPWLGSLVVDPQYQKRGIGKQLADAVVAKSKELKFENLYLFALDPTIPQYYENLGWQKVGIDTFKNHPVTVMVMKL
jgi:N-acetylglutamate synthase-like GNAT family acetyltransferase